MSSKLKNLKKYVNFTNSSSTFRSIMNKYKNKLKISRELNKEIIMKQIYSKIQKIENEEKENDFIISEVRRNAQINQEILYSFGTKVLHHLNEAIKVNVTTKMDKNKFLGITKQKNKSKKKIKFNCEKYYYYNKAKNDNKYNENKFIILPRIIKNRNKAHSKEKNLEENSLMKNRLRLNSDDKNYIKNIKKLNIPKNKRKNLVDSYNYSSFRKERSTRINSNSLKELTPIKKRKENSNDDSIIFVKGHLLTDRDTKKIPKINMEYIDYIRTMGEQFSETEKKQEKYFYKNKYGVDAFKLKYNYLKKKYFN